MAQDNQNNHIFLKTGVKLIPPLHERKLFRQIKKKAEKVKGKEYASKMTSIWDFLDEIITKTIDPRKNKNYIIPIEKLLERAEMLKPESTEHAKSEISEQSNDIISALFEIINRQLDYIIKNQKKADKKAYFFFVIGALVSALGIFGYRTILNFIIWIKTSF